MGAHNSIVDQALPGARFADRALIKLGSLMFDLTTQSQSQSYLHSMAERGQNALAQQAGTAEFVSNTTGAASMFEAAGRHALAMLTLGAAIHPLMDATSPSHTTSCGKPIVWDPENLTAHRAGESGTPTLAQQRRMNAQIQRAYDQAVPRQRGGAW